MHSKNVADYDQPLLPSLFYSAPIYIPMYTKYTRYV